jgi:PAS domain S-box-containing protein
MSSVEILIADDHEVFRRSLRMLVESRPEWRVCGEAGDGIEAIEKVRELHPDVVLMDINMPRMDGLEATRIIRRDIPDSKVIIVTQNHASIAREQARSVDAEGSITKSDLARDLFPTIDNLLGQGKSEARSRSRDEATHPEEWVRAGGALGKLVHDFDWSKTPLGPLEHWPRSLKTVVRVMLASRFAMWMSWGPELTFLYNDAYAKMTLGKKHPWALGKPSQKVWEEIWGDIGPRIQKVLESGQATWDEGLLLFLERSGYREETYHTFSYSPLLGDDSRVAGHLCVVTEETDRVIGDRRLKTLRSLAAELSKTISEDDVVASVSSVLGNNQLDLPFTLMYLVSPDGKQARLACRTGMVAGHPAAPDVIELAERNQKWPLQELLNGKDSLLVEDLAARFDSVPAGAWDKSPSRALLLPIASQTQATAAGVLVAGINPYRPLDVSYAGFFNLIAGQIAASIANAHAYEEEKKRNEALAELDRAKTEFFSNVSHEFRTPLTLMLAPLEDTLADRERLPAEDRERLEVAHRNSLRLLKLVNNLLDFSRIEAGRLDASYEPTDLCQLTSELASVFRSAIERAGLRFTINCPSIEDPVYVDREMWEKIVFNLLSNALKFTFKGEIEVSIQKRDKDVEFAVRDTGTGIPASDLPHLFERFYRVKGVHGRTMEGTGIGLALVQQLVKLHGGTVRVQSEWGRGSTFTISIPLGKHHLPADRIGAARTLRSTAVRGETYVEQAIHSLPGTGDESDDVPSGPSFPAFSSSPAAENKAAKIATILLVDDNADMRNYVERLLRQQYEVVAVADGQAALESAQLHRPDLILSDVMTPRLDGFGLLRRVRSDASLRAIPVILLSARAGEEARIEGLGAGADDYLVKPFSARELLARVGSHLAMARVRREAAEVERELRNDAERTTSLLAAIVDSSDDAIVSKNLDGFITTWNQSAERIFGYTAEEAIGQHITLIVPPDHREEEMDILSRLRRGERIDHLETIRQRKDGALLELAVTISPVKDSTGRVIGASKVARDITERRRAERTLATGTRQQKALFRFADALHRALTLDEVYGATFNAIFTALGCDRASILLSDEAGIMRFVSWRGLSKTYRAAVDGHSAWSPGEENPQPVCISDIDSADISDALKATVKAEGIAALAFIPLLSNGKLIGKFMTYFDSPHAFSGNEIDLSLTIARQLAFAIGRKQNDEALKQSEQAFRALSETLDAEVRTRTRELEERNADVLRQSHQLRELSWRLLLAQDEERRHIARELHDSAGQTLSVLGMNLANVVQKSAQKAPELAKEIESIQEMVQQLHGEIRTTSYLLHPPLLDESGLNSAIAWYVEGLLERSGLEIDLDIADDFGRLPRDMELVIFRIVQECLTNIHRHAETKTASIRMARDANLITLDIRDQGKGMSPARLAEVQSGRSGVGIRGMRERLRQFDGTLNFELDGSGTRVVATIPVPKLASFDARDAKGPEPEARDVKGRDKDEPLQAAV